MHAPFEMSSKVDVWNSIAPWAFSTAAISERFAKENQDSNFKKLTTWLAHLRLAVCIRGTDVAAASRTRRARLFFRRLLGSGQQLA